jgi:anthranilate synthase component 2
VEHTNKNILFIDNFDSFTYNLVHYCEALNVNVHVVRNNEIPWEEVLNYDAVVLSPGPGLPEESGDLMKFIATFWERIPMLGICLGCQAMALHDGGKLKNLSQVLHGVSSEAEQINDSVLFDGLAKKFEVGHYHSWVIDNDFLPTSFDVTARKSDGLVMAIQHKALPLMAVQFHPESVLTKEGIHIMKNWINSI